MKIRIFIILILLITILNASETFIISDYDYINQDYTFQETWKFVKSYKNKVLTYDNVEIIYRYCVVYQINILIVLSRLQFESNLLINNENEKSIRWLKHRAMGYGLYLHIRRDGLKFYKYGGFDIQVYKGIELMRKAFDRWDNTKKIFIKDLKIKVKPINAGTYALYYYTPFYGEHNVYKWKNKAIGILAFESLYPKLKKRYNEVNNK